MKYSHTREIEETGVSHNPEIKKRVFLGRGEVPGLMMFGEATFLPGQSVEEHVHDTMCEVFLIKAGQAKFVVEGQEITAVKDDMVAIEAGEKHSQANPFEEPVVWVYFGIATS